MLASWKKSYCKLSTLKSRDITLPTKAHIVKPMVFPVVMYGYESWTIKQAEHWRIDAFELWCWRRLLRVPWTGRRSNQSILKEINPEYSLEGVMLNWIIQYFELLSIIQYLEHLMQRADSLDDFPSSWCWERLRKGEVGNRGWDGWMTSLTQWPWIWASSRR